jgi:hypothetical protein
MTNTRSRPETNADDEWRSDHLVRVLLIAIPAFVAFWVGVVALAVSFTNTAYVPALAMAAGVGVLAGVFWAGWYAFVDFSRREESERRDALAAEHRAPAARGAPEPAALDEDKRESVSALEA